MKETIKKLLEETCEGVCTIQSNVLSSGNMEASVQGDVIGVTTGIAHIFAILETKHKEEYEMIIECAKEIAHDMVKKGDVK